MSLQGKGISCCEVFLTGNSSQQDKGLKYDLQFLKDKRNLLDKEYKCFDQLDFDKYQLGIWAQFLILKDNNDRLCMM